MLLLGSMDASMRTNFPCQLCSTPPYMPFNVTSGASTSASSPLKPNGISKNPNCRMAKGTRTSTSSAPYNTATLCARLTYCPSSTSREFIIESNGALISALARSSSACSRLAIASDNRAEVTSAKRCASWT